MMSNKDFIDRYKVKIRKFKYHDYFSQELKNLVREMLSYKDRNRPSLNKILRTSIIK